MDWNWKHPNMYIKTESGEVIEFHDRHHPKSDEISCDNYSELYEKLYGQVGVKPVDGKSSWQLFAIRMNCTGEMCIITFDTVKDANQALKSFCRGRESLNGWDAAEYIKGSSGYQSAYYSHLDDDIIIVKRYIRTESGEILGTYEVYRHVHEIKKSSRKYHTEHYGRPFIKPVDGTSSWQLLSARLDDDGEEICIAMFDTVKDASDALDSLDTVYREGGGWDAIEYKTPQKSPQTKKLNRNPHLSKSVAELGLSVRAINCLNKAGVWSIRSLVTRTEESLLKHQNLGPITLYEIKRRLAGVRLTLGMSFSEVYPDRDPDKKDDDTDPDSDIKEKSSTPYVL